ncbi:MAG: phenylalanine--tRNA ligase subunit beta [Cyclobacteriaceae bacterium]
MKISYNWLKQFIDVDLPVEEVGDILTKTGLEVEGIEKFESIKGGLEGLIVGEVLTCVRHPDADKLSLTTVDLGNGTPSQIVCGAPNVAAGQKVIVAPVGSTIYPADKEEGFKLKKAKIRGQESNGMICSSYEIGLDSSHDGILVLDTKTKTGTQAADVLKIENDHIFEIGLTPNRADAASHIGVCRDLKAALNKPINWPSVDSFKVDNHDLPIKVIVEDYAGAPRYSGVTIDNLRVKDSPDWLKNRLSSIGLTPINNIVDITNYVNHSLGQPMHAFDYDEIVGGKVIVKTMPEGTKFTTLDEKERKLTSKDLMICNEKNGMCIGGVFGGVKSGIKETTKRMFLECAYFSPDYIRKTAQHHGLKTDASFRYERGTDPNLTVYALKWASLLIKELAGGTVSSEIVDLYPKPITDFEIEVKFKNIDRLIGKQLPKDEIFQTLENLDVSISEKTGEGFKATVPPYRVDVQREADIIEEILRIHGYDNVALDEDLNADYLAEFPDVDKDDIQFKISELLASRGFYEILTNSLTKPAYSENIGVLDSGKDVHILNKLSDELGVMRQSLLPNGLEVITYNISHRQKNLKFFEFGKTYQEKEGKFKEQEILAVYITGNQHPESWIADNKAVSFHDLAAAVFTIYERLRVQDYETNTFSDEMFSSGIELTYNKQSLGKFGKVSTKVRELADCPQEVFYAELYWDRILKKSNQAITYREVPKFPEVRRDLSVVVDKKVQFSEIQKLALAAERNLIKRMNVFSIYEGENIGSDKKAYAISFILQDEKQTLKDKQIDKVLNRLIHSFENELGALIRK